MVRARFRAEGAGVCIQSPRGDPVTVCGRWAGRDGGERPQQETLADRAGASWRGRSVVRWVAQAPTLPSGRKWNRSQPCQGAAELGSSGPMLGKMQSFRRRALRVSRPAMEKKRRRRVLVVTSCSPRPMRAAQRARLCASTWTASQAALAAKRPDGR